ncbi:2590eedb-3c64-45a5-97ad-ac6fab2e734d [Thermothielavioides terrestris]|uniref:2590eedb-3c64-45a5-97ad-ac6fab2e734d n=1 Tax=Thermothielavioides terrestris TaxID=2587410 RepID=A0A3S4ANB7_9PEZI|nr:2590eedb-3c64-45a5-97ad-ac6fab2e734d [Thermothielavioides terrestris]
MDRLPEEIIAMIITHLAADPPNHHHHGNPGAAPPRTTGLAAYAAVSRRWQPRIEALTFAHITLTPARLASPLAARALTPDRVRRLVRSIYLEVLLPPYDEAARRRVEDDAERAANDAVFTDAVLRLFALLAAAGAGEDYRPKIHLSMAARCESDMEDWEGRHRRRPVSPTAPRDLFERRYESSYLDLRLAMPGQSAGSEAEALPEVHCILGFGVQRIDSPLLHYRHFAPRALCLMASRMSGLEQVYWVLRDKEKRDVELRKKLRADFADSLQALPSTLRSFHLMYGGPAPKDHFFERPSILDEADQDGHDKLSLALHKLSQRLFEFHLTADVGPEIFWPSGSAELDDGDSPSPPYWPNMMYYGINPGAISPSGRWRFRHRTDSFGDDSDHVVESDVSDSSDVAPGDEIHRAFRQEVDPDAVRPLLLAAARAAGRMPALRHMSFVIGSPPTNAGWLRVSYTTAPSSRRSARARLGGADAPRLVVGGRPLSHLDLEKEVVEAWEEAARKHSDAELRCALVTKRLFDRYWAAP